MKLFGYDFKVQRAANPVTSYNRLVPNMLYSWFYGREWAKTSDQTSLLKAYRSWEYAAAQFNATKFASCNLRLYAGKQGGAGQKLLVPTKRVKQAQQDRLFKGYHHLKAVRKADDIVEIMEHPFLDLMQNVNGFMNQFDLMEMTMIYQELAGECPWYLAIGPMGIPTEIWPLRPDRFYVVPDKDKFINHYVYTKTDMSGLQTIVPGTDKIELTTEEVIHFKYPNPTDPYHGMSPLMAAADAYNLNQNMSAFENAMFSNQLVSPGYFKNESTNKSATDAEFQETTKRISEVWTGVKNTGRTGYLEGVDFVPLNMSPKEMSYLQGRKHTKEEIYMVHGIPLSLWDVTANRANAETAEYIHAAYTMTPRLKRFEQKLNEQLMPRYDEKLFVAFDSVISDDKDFRLREEESAMRSGRWSINEVRQSHGEDWIEGGDDHYIPMGMIPLDMAALGVESLNAGVTSPANPEKVLR